MRGSVTPSVGSAPSPALRLGWLHYEADGLVGRVRRFGRRSRRLNVPYNNAVERTAGSHALAAAAHRIVRRQGPQAGSGGTTHMAEPYRERLATLVRVARPSNAHGVRLECRHFFSGAALYANGTICASL